MDDINSSFLQTNATARLGKNARARLAPVNWQLWTGTRCIIHIGSDNITR
jgi:hypothetical protein